LRDWRPTRKREQNFYTDLIGLWNRLRGTSVRLLTIPQWAEMYAWQAAKRMITGLFVESAKTWRQAATESMRGPEIYAALQKELRGPVGGRVRELIAENAKLIKTLPHDAAVRASKMAAMMQQRGERPKSIEQFLPTAFAFEARRLARTEMSKASTALIEARSEDLGIPAFVWDTAQDERVRKSHRNMQGVIVFWKHLPSPEALIGQKSYGHYAPGGTFQCRCGPLPIVSTKQLSWPHKCYVGDRIQYVSLAAFRRLAEKFENQPLRRAA
jgi:SPP1 gp7 family putative phage head morphogenesis protein